MHRQETNENTLLLLPALQQNTALIPATVNNINYLKDALPRELLFHILDLLAPEEIIKLESVEKFYNRSKRKSGLWGNSESSNLFWHKKCLRHFPDEFPAQYDPDVYYFEAFKKTYLEQYEELSIKRRKLFSFTKEQDVYSLNNTHYTLDEICVIDKKNRYLIEGWASRLNNQSVYNRFYQIAQSYYTAKINNIDIIDVNKKFGSINATIMYFAVLLDQADEIAPLVVQGCELNNLCGPLTPISYAAYYGKLAITKKIIDLDNKMLEQRDNYRRTPLFHAVEGNKPHMVAELIKRGAKLNGVYHNLQNQNDDEMNGMTALHLAVKKGFTEIVVMLTEAGADATLKPLKSDLYAIHIAARNGNLAMVQALLKANPRLLNQPNIWQETALMHVASKGHIAIAKYFLSFWNVLLDIPTKNPAAVPMENHLTALHVAIMKNHPDIVALLVAAGAKPKIANELGNQPIHTAVSKKIAEIVKILLDKDADLVNEKNKKGFTPIMQAVLDENEEMLALLLQYQPNLLLVNDNNADAQAIHYAAAKGNLAIVKMLLKNHPSLLNAKDGFGRTPFMHATMTGHNEIVDYLIAQEANIHEKTARGKSSLYFSIANGNTAVAKLLMQKGVEVNNALHDAAENGQLQVAKEILNANPQILNDANERGDTALMVAIHYGKLDVFTELLVRGAKIDVNNNTGESALYLAAKLGHSDMVNALLNHGAKVDVNKPLEKGELNAEAKAKLRLAEYLAVRPTQAKYKTVIKFFCFEFYFGSPVEEKMFVANAMGAHFFANKAGKVDLSHCANEKEKDSAKQAMKKSELGSIYRELKLAQRGG